MSSGKERTRRPSRASGEGNRLSRRDRDSDDDSRTTTAKAGENKTGCSTDRTACPMPASRRGAIASLILGVSLSQGNVRVKAGKASDDAPGDGGEGLDTARCLTKDEATQVLVEASPDLVEYFAAWIDDDVEAEDLAQETLIYVLRQLERLSFPNDLAVLGYLYKKALGMRIDYCRRADRKTFISLDSCLSEEEPLALCEDDLDPNDLPEWHPDLGYGVTPEVRAEIMQDWIMVVSVISALPPKQSAILVTFIARHEEGDEDQEPASLADRVNLHRGRKELEKRCGLGRSGRSVANRTSSRRRPPPTTTG